jgi:chromosome partitioning protein
MGKIIAFVSQKGGVSKSTLARGVSREAQHSGLEVKVADLDTQQGTFSEWHRIRLNNGYDSVGSVEIFSKVKEALKQADNYDLLIIDGAARASSATLEIAKVADLVILPTCASRDDLTPAIKLAYELQKKGIAKNNIAFALTRVTTQAEIEDAREYINESGFQTLDGSLIEKPAYRQAQNQGLTITETKYKSLNLKADELLSSIITLLLKD